MDQALIHSIIEHTKLSNSSSIPVEISKVAYMQAGINRGQQDELYADVMQLVELFIDDNAEYDEAQLEIIFNMQLKDEIEGFIVELASKYECNPNGIVNFIAWAVYKELAKLMFNKGFILRGIDCYTLQKQAEIVAEATGGHSFAEIKDIGVRDPNRIANLPQKKENEKQGIKIARHILSQDTDQLLTTNDIRELVLDALKHKHQNNKAILKTLPKEPKALRYWFKGNNKLPAYLSKGGRPKGDNRAKQQLINDIRASIIK